MQDLISRQAAIDAINTMFAPTPTQRDVVEDCLEILDNLPSAQPEQRWIPCGERLPKQGQEVICQCRANIIKVLKLDADDDWYQDAEHCYMGGFVTAWMPLPEPWRGEGADE